VTPDVRFRVALLQKPPGGSRPKICRAASGVTCRSAKRP